MTPKPERKFLVIGSVALSHWVDLNRPPGDIDIMSQNLPFQPSPCPSKLLLENTWFGSASEYMLENNKHDVFLDLNFLFTLKVSHAAWDIKWEKTMFHIHLMKVAGAEIDHALLKMLRTHWEKVHSKKRIKMDKMNDEFFVDAVNRKIDHDKLHEMVAHPNRPANELMRENLNSPLFSSKLWNDSAPENKMRCAVEETAVIAFERYFDFGICRKSHLLQAVSKAFKNLVTTMTYGDFNVFLILNAQRIKREASELVEAKIDVVKIVG
jgi:hypothetical protein